MNRCTCLYLFVILMMFLPIVVFGSEIEKDRLFTDHLRITFGHTGSQQDTTVQVLGRNLVVRSITGIELEETDQVGVLNYLQYGAGDVDGLLLEVSPLEAEQETRPIQSIWQYLLDHGDQQAAERLSQDPGLLVEAPVITIQTSIDGTTGFSFTPDQVRQSGALWLPDHDAYITLAENPIPFSDHLASLKGKRILEEVAEAPDASLADFVARWKDMGDPHAWHPDWEATWLGLRGHLVCMVPRPGSLYKTCVGRWGDIRPDHGSPHAFRFDFLWEESSRWISQELENGLPLIKTVIEQEGIEYQLEQFVVPRPDWESAPHPGEVPGACLTRLKIPSGSGEYRLSFRFGNRDLDKEFQVENQNDCVQIVDTKTGRTWMALTMPEGGSFKSSPMPKDKGKGLMLSVDGQLSSMDIQSLYIAVFNPAVDSDQLFTLSQEAYQTARSGVVQYWEEWIARGAQFEVPDPVVNELVRANIWHALRLPRNRLDEDGKPVIDLPYSNTAYGQTSIDWPVNQSVYVDYMLYGLRNYPELAAKELKAIFDVQQQHNGRIKGYANWYVYTPAQLYTVAQCFLLSQNREIFDQLLPASLKSLEWCFDRIEKPSLAEEAAGLVHGPLNDLSWEESTWAFNQAYFYAGIEMMGKALERIGHPMAEKCHQVASKLRQDIEHAFARASVKSPVVQLNDGTWVNYVPSNAMVNRRLMDVWYPTDIDTGSVHLSRLEAIDPNGWLTDCLLNDHEDNLYLNQWGMANEPVYNQQAKAYLLRDNPKAAIRAFYSMTACAFSHGQLEPVEHRWAWGQYFGPPSTDGAWFDLLRHMLVQERGNTLLLAQATPRAWLEDGKSIRVVDAPTWFGGLDMVIESHAAHGWIDADVYLADGPRPEVIRLRLRHPEGLPMRKVTLNGKAHEDFDPVREWIHLPESIAGRIQIRAIF